MEKNTNRRTALKNILAGSAAMGMASSIPNWACASELNSNDMKLKGNITHSVCKWCYEQIPLEKFCAAVVAMGIKGVDLMGPKDWDTLKKYKLDSPMCNGAEINLVDGFNDPKFHAQLEKNYSEMIPLVAKAGYKNLICFSGNRRGLDDEKGINNCVEGLKKIIPLAEKHGVVLVMELLNSKQDHIDYQCDNTTWGVELCKRLGSENFKLLYDIYHMQIDEGNVIANIRKYHSYFAHYHTGGVPGRNEIDQTQELYYPAIMKAIVATGFKGYVAQEFIPKSKEPLVSLAEAIKICDI